MKGGRKNRIDFRKKKKTRVGAVVKEDLESL